MSLYCTIPIYHRKPAKVANSEKYFFIGLFCGRHLCRSHPHARARFHIGIQRSPAPRASPAALRPVLLAPLQFFDPPPFFGPGHRKCDFCIIPKKILRSRTRKGPRRRREDPPPSRGRDIGRGYWRGRGCCFACGRLACGLGGPAVAVRWRGCGPCVCVPGCGRWPALSGGRYGLRPAACFVCAGVYACVSRWPAVCWWRWPAVSPVLRPGACRAGLPVQASQVRTHGSRAGAGLPVPLVCRPPVASLPVCRPADLRRLPPPRVFTTPGLVS